MEIIRAGNYTSTACAAVGIHPTQYYRWLKKGQESRGGRFHDFWLAVQQAEAESQVEAVRVVQKHARDSPHASVEFLSRRWPAQFGRREHAAPQVSQPTAIILKFGDGTPLQLPSSTVEVVAADAADPA